MTTTNPPFLRAAALAILALALSHAAVRASDEASPVIYIIGLDFSKSNPLILKGDKYQRYRSNAAKELADDIRRLPVGSIVLLRSFGDNNAYNQPVQGETKPLTARPPTATTDNADAKAETVFQYVDGLQALIERNRWPAQNWTYIVSFLGVMADLADRTAGKNAWLKSAMQRQFDFHTRIVLLSDGIEDTEDVGGKGSGVHLDWPKSKLPPPARAIPRCDELKILGLGGEGPPKSVKENPAARAQRLKKEWGEWAAAAACERFFGIDQL